MLKLLPRLSTEKLIAVLTVDSPEDVPPLVDALLSGGIRAVELTLRTEAALEALIAMRTASSEILLGAGTVLTPEQVSQVKDAGADFAVSPGCNPRVLQAAQEAALPFGPGIMTPSDIEAALPYDCRVLKFFPAETSGGLPHLKSLSAPYKHLGLRFIPLGGCNEQNLPEYLASPLIAAVGGSWIAPADLIEAKDWQSIRERAARAREIADRVA